MEDFKQTRIAQNHKGAVRAIAFPPGISDKFGTCGADGTIR